MKNAMKKKFGNEVRQASEKKENKRLREKV